jgi:subtilase family serine protease
VSAVAAGVAAALVAGGLWGGAGAAQAAPSAVGVVAVAGVRPVWAAPQDAVGVPAASSVVTTRVFLAGADPQGLAAYAAAVSTPGNAEYRHFLSTSQAAARYAPTGAQEAAVAVWLTKSGLRVTDANQQYVEASGTTGEVDRAYGVVLRDYSGGEARAAGASSAVAPDRDPVVPDDLAADVATITGLSSISQPMYAQHVTAAAASQELRRRAGTTTPSGPLIPSPCSAYYGQEADTKDPVFEGAREPYAVCGYSASQLRSAYGAAGHSGGGTTVAILDAYNSPTIVGDVNQWSAENGLPALTSGQYSSHVTPSAWNDEAACGGPSGWASEQSLDVEAVHAMAPSADIVYYGANSCQDSDLLAALSDLITHHLAQVISDSWGGPLDSTSGSEPASTVAEYDHLFQLAAVEGITVNFSAGDCGDNSPATSCGGANGEESSSAQTTFPASDPWVTAVGGTSAAIDAHGWLAWSTSWGTEAWLLDSAGTAWSPAGWIFGGGGGTSADFAQPKYQAGAVPSSLADTLLTGAAASSPRRVTPDISLDADPFTGLLVGETQPLPGGKTGYAEAAIGGTSLASPLLAGLEADAIALRGGVSLGFVNPTLYCACMAHDSDTIRDVTDTPSNAAPPIAEVFPPFEGQAAAVAELGQDGALHATAGYDDATGLGTPGPWFVDDLASE